MADWGGDTAAAKTRGRIRLSDPDYYWNSRACRSPLHAVLVLRGTGESLQYHLPFIFAPHHTINGPD
ncbi:hypothetical protein GN956_G16391 [Arapaima gigas]